jgi:hypothetical protein
MPFDVSWGTVPEIGWVKALRGSGVADRMQPGRLHEWEVRAITLVLTRSSLACAGRHRDQASLAAWTAGSTGPAGRAGSGAEALHKRKIQAEMPFTSRFAVPPVVPPRSRKP